MFGSIFVDVDQHASPDVNVPTNKKNEELSTLIETSPEAKQSLKLLCECR